jgi:hypothetical protein
MRSSSLTFVITLFVAFLAVQRPAFAYLDPGTGSIIVQGIIAAAVGAMVTIRLYWSRIKALFSSKPHDDGEDVTADVGANRNPRD